MNTPGQNSNAVAELVFALMLYLARGAFSGKSGSELRGKKIGLQAYGAVGRCVTPIAKGFGMEVYAFDPFVPAEAIKKDGVIPVVFAGRTLQNLRLRFDPYSQDQGNGQLHQFRPARPDEKRGGPDQHRPRRGDRRAVIAEDVRRAPGLQVRRRRGAGLRAPRSPKNSPGASFSRPRKWGRRPRRPTSTPGWPPPARSWPSSKRATRPSRSTSKRPLLKTCGRPDRRRVGLRRRRRHPGRHQDLLRLRRLRRQRHHRRHRPEPGWACAPSRPSTRRWSRRSCGRCWRATRSRPSRRACCSTATSSRPWPPSSGSIRRIPLVVDPVFAATSGSRLIKPRAIRVLCELLFPLAALVTPNLPEAEFLCGGRSAPWTTCAMPAKRSMKLQRALPHEGRATCRGRRRRPAGGRPGRKDVLPRTWCAASTATARAALFRRPSPPISPAAAPCASPWPKPRPSSPPACAGRITCKPGTRVIDHFSPQGLNRSAMAEENSVSVIGGGSSGMMAAISAARCGAAVMLLERKDRVGKKLLATGNGRCNLSNADCALSRFHGGDRGFHRRGAVALPGRASRRFFRGARHRLQDRGARAGSIPIPGRRRRCWTSCAGNWSA